MAASASALGPLAVMGAAAAGFAASTKASRASFFMVGILGGERAGPSGANHKKMEQVRPCKRQPRMQGTRLAPTEGRPPAQITSCVLSSASPRRRIVGDLVPS
jgi:hypothetical protein